MPIFGDQGCYSCDICDYTHYDDSFIYYECIECNNIFGICLKCCDDVDKTDYIDYKHIYSNIKKYIEENYSFLDDMINDIKVLKNIGLSSNYFSSKNISYKTNSIVCFKCLNT